MYEREKRGVYRVTGANGGPNSRGSPLWKDDVWAETWISWKSKSCDPGARAFQTSNRQPVRNRGESSLFQEKQKDQCDRANESREQVVGDKTRVAGRRRFMCDLGGHCKDLDVMVCVMGSHSSMSAEDACSVKIDCIRVSMQSTLKGDCTAADIIREHGGADYKRWWGRQLKMAILEVYFEGSYCKICW